MRRLELAGDKEVEMQGERGDYWMDDVDEYMALGCV